MSTAAAAHGTRSDPRERRWPVVVAGGGLVGATLAAALGRSGVPVALVDTAPPASRGTAERDQRPIALAESSRRILDTLGLWSSLAPLATAIRAIHVSDRGHFAAARMHARDAGVESLGHVVEAADLAGVVEQALAGLPRVERLRPATVTDVSAVGDGVRVTVRSGEDAAPARDGDVLGAALLVLCDGGRSPLREALGIAVRSHDYRQCAVAARVHPRRDHRGVAFERFSATGPLALLPMADRTCGLVWTLPSELAGEVAALGDADFLAALTQAFGRRLGGFVASGPRSLFPLHLVTARAIVGPRLAIVGNAAHHLHPVAGQGLNLGLRDVAALAEVVVGALRAGDDPGGAGALARYGAWRRADHARVSGVTHALVRLFSNDHLPLAAARGLGLLGFDLLPPLKRRFASLATGLDGRMSRLARGLAP